VVKRLVNNGLVQRTATNRNIGRKRTQSVGRAIGKIAGLAGTLAASFHIKPLIGGDAAEQD
jgi:hypothetical protein